MTRLDKSRFAEKRAAVCSGNGFSLIELLIVITILAILLGIIAPVFMKSSLKARQIAKEVVQGNFTRARSHAIATGIPTAVIVSQYRSGNQGGKAIGIAEMKAPEEDVNNPVPQYQVSRVLQRWDVLPGNMLFLSRQQVNAPFASIMDESLSVNTVLAGNPTSATYVVFSPSGQIVHPADKPIEILLGPARLTSGGNVELLERTNGQPSFDRLQVNRLTGKVRLRPATMP
jgi:prepilin-type N-terminal cleavage/methylation domain-containing protein